MTVCRLLTAAEAALARLLNRNHDKEIICRRINKVSIVIYTVSYIVVTEGHVVAVAHLAIDRPYIGQLHKVD
jgi:hypothetical protein